MARIVLILLVLMFEADFVKAEVALSVTQVRTGDTHTCAITASEELYCWGRNHYGQLGDGTQTDQLTPTLVSIEKVKDVSLGMYHSCAITTANQLYCWGRQKNGQVGKGDVANQLKPVQILDNVKDFKLGTSYTCALLANDQLYCWGSNQNGQIGDGTTTNKLSPTLILSNVKNFNLRSSHTCAITKDDQLYCWGLNTYGQIGNGDDVDQLKPIKVLDNVRNVDLGIAHTCAVTTTNQLYCWGINTYGQIGDGTKTKTFKPIFVLGDVVDVYVEESRTCAIAADAKLYCWGRNDSGRIGTGDEINNKKTPQEILNNIRSVQLGMTHTCALTKENELLCWGENKVGQVGVEDTANKTVPQNILSNVKSLSINSSKDNPYTCVVATFGRLYCWGDNSYGMLGNGTRENKSSPIEIFSGGEVCIDLSNYNDIGMTCSNGLLGACYRVSNYVCNDNKTTPEIVCRVDMNVMPSDELCDGVDNDCDGEIDNDCDSCPEDPEKKAAGQCGCGEKDIDTDGDGVADCVDGCPDDPEWKESEMPKLGCKLAVAEVIPITHDPSVDLNRVVVPDKKPLPSYTIEKERYYQVFLEHFTSASFTKRKKVKEHLMTPIENNNLSVKNLNFTAMKKDGKSLEKWQSQIRQQKLVKVTRIRVKGNGGKVRTTKLRSLNGKKNSLNLVKKDKYSYKIRYKVKISSKNKVAYTKWSNTQRINGKQPVKR